MHPLSTALLLLGYALALPISSRMTTIVERQNRLALFGHQTGIMIVILGWLISGRIFVAVAHVIWLIIASTWFRFLGPAKPRSSGSSASS